MPRISRPASFVAGTILALGALGASTAVAASDATDLLKAPIQGSQPSDPPLFGATPGAAPWVISSGEAKLAGDGTVKVEVVGLVIPGRGNPLATLSASVACNGAIVATTPTVPFSTTGNAEVNAVVNLPDRCLAPAVLLNPNGNAAVYIAATGR